MKQVIIIIFFLLNVNSFSQTLEQIFKDYDFSNHRYSLYLIDSRFDLDFHKTWERDSLGRLLEFENRQFYYCDDITTLKEIKSEWIAIPDGPMNECGYDFNIYLTIDDSIVSQMWVNLDCKELIIKGDNSYTINPEMITKFYPKFKNLKRRKFTCDNLHECRDYWESIQKDSLFVLKDISGPFWTKYNGYLSFSYASNHQLKQYQVEELVVSEISSKHPFEKFRIQSVDHFEDKGSEIYNIKLLCNKSLYDQFTSFNDHKWVDLGACKFSVFWKD